MKPKKPQKENQKERQDRDFFQTPKYATNLIVEYISKDSIVWECASGNGKIASMFDNCIQTDIQSGFDFLDDKPDFDFDVIVTNPPYSLKKKFFDRCIHYKVPFALLLPVDFCGWVLRAMRDYDIKWVVPTRRIDFITPTGKSGKNSNAQYHSGWMTYMLPVPHQITVVEISKQDKENV